MVSYKQKDSLKAETMWQNVLEVYSVVEISHSYFMLFLIKALESTRYVLGWYYSK